VIEYVTLAFQIVILVILTGSAWVSVRTRRNINRTLDALHAYRREVEWLTHRIETLEKQKAAEGWKVINGRQGP
jgi:hypothetical protein